MEPPPLPQPSTPPPGWHDDPQDPTSLRYWDGNQWTDNRAPKPTAEPTKKHTGDWSPQRIAAAIGAAAIVVGSFSPWLTVSSAFGSLTVNGTDESNDGLATLVGGLIILALIVAAKYVGAIVVAFLTGAVLLYDLINVRNKISENEEEFIQASVGWGLWLALVGAAVALVGTGIHEKAQRADANPVEPVTP